jgi:peroxidase
MRGLRSLGSIAAVLVAVALGVPKPGLADDRMLDAMRSLMSSVLESVSPALRINRQRPGASSSSLPGPSEFRSIDGSGNNLDNPQMGAAYTPLRRRMPSHYADGASSMDTPFRPGPREISNLVNHQEESVVDPLRGSGFLWQWGQFVDHDIDLSDGVDPPEPTPILVPTGDPYFDPSGTGTQVIAFNRSIYDPSTGDGTDNPRQQINEISHWIDASNVYGSDEARAAALRINDGTGRLKTSVGNLLPPDDGTFSNAGHPMPGLFLAGDVRANEQVGLTSMHTLFVREHNWLAARYAFMHPDWDGDRIYQAARRMVGAEIQVITYREFLPALLGSRALKPYRGYRPDVDASIMNIFSTAAYRYGHSAIGPTLLRLDRFGRDIPEGPLALRDAFFSPDRIRLEGGIEPVLRGLAAQPSQRVDLLVVDDVRNFLFGPPGAGGFDLAALNIQRGRDHGLPPYNYVRKAYGFEPAQTFADISSDPDVRERLAAAYASVDDVDLWIGGLAEDPVPRGHLGPLFAAIVAEQFEHLRDGDRFWYARTLNMMERMIVEHTRLSDIIRRNTTIGREIPNDVFHVPRGR